MRCSGSLTVSARSISFAAKGAQIWLHCKGRTSEESLMLKQPRGLFISLWCPNTCECITVRRISTAGRSGMPPDVGSLAWRIPAQNVHAMCEVASLMSFTKIIRIRLPTIKKKYWPPNFRFVAGRVFSRSGTVLKMIERLSR